MKKVFFIVLISFFICTYLNAATLKDVPPSHWGYEAVNFLVENGILSGMPDGTFKGNDFTTRYQTAVSIYRTIQYMQGNPSDNVIGESDEMLDYKIESMQALVESMAKSMEKIGREYGIILDKVGAGTFDHEIGNSENEELMVLRNKVSSIENTINDFKNFTLAYNSEVSVIKSSVDENRMQIRQLKLDEENRFKKMEEMENRLNIMTWVSVSALAVGIGGIVAGIIAINSINSNQQ